MPNVDDSAAMLLADIDETDRVTLAACMMVAEWEGELLAFPAGCEIDQEAAADVWLYAQADLTLLEARAAFAADVSQGAVVSDERTEKELIARTRRQEFQELQKRQRARRDELWKQVESLEEKIQAQLDFEFKDKVTIAQRVLNEAVRNVELERVELAAQAPIYPIGTKLYEWHNTKRWGRADFQLSGKVGIVEIFSHDSPRHIKGRIPAIGALCVRPLKTDGKPGLSALTLDSWNVQTWLPDGIKFGEG